MASPRIVEVTIDPLEAVPQNDEFLAELEKLAESRYTDQDEEFMAVKTRRPSTPPIQPAYSSNDRARGNRDRRGGYGQSSYGGNQHWDRSRNYDRQQGGYNRRGDYGRWNNNRY